MAGCDLKLYRGYANKKELVIFGHVVEKYPRGDHKYNRKGFRYARTIIQLFSIKTIPNVPVILNIGGASFEAESEYDRYFRFQVPLPSELVSGWHTYSVNIQHNIEGKDVHLTKEEEFFIPYQSSYGLISDIDDTFLISHSRKSFKKLFLLLSKNVQARKPFDDVVKHYQLLSFASTQHPHTNNNIFFYVSSSEWNLYDMIVRFAELNGLPKAILKLKRIKSGLDDFISTGSGSHDHKLRKIHNIVSFYPELQFILLGDDTQHDPQLYSQICQEFPERIKAVYIRRTRKRAKTSTSAALKEMESLGIEICYFEHSNKAVIHSLDKGLVFQTPTESTE